MEVKILDVREDLASVTVTSSKFCDYLQMAKLDGQWKIVSVLWKKDPGASEPTDR